MVINFFPFGRYKRRMPFSYDVYSSRLEPKFKCVSSVTKADCIVVSNYKDIEENEVFFQKAFCSNRNLKLIIFSEEPFWDSLSKIDITNPCFKIKHGELAGLNVHLVNHSISDVFHFIRIPYFLTTDSSYIARYIVMFRKLLSLKPETLLSHWKSTNYDIFSVAEKRKAKHFDLVIEESNLIGLSRFRTVLMQSFSGKKLINGKGWNTNKKRQSLPDWHVDKLSVGFKCAKFVSAIENTHLNNYITEKLFDALAVHGFPVYYASESHRIHSFLSSSSFVNLYGLDVESAVECISSYELSKFNAESYLEDVNLIYDTFSNVEYIYNERNMFMSRTYEQFSQILNE